MGRRVPRASPGAKLLRASRLFSVPKALPEPASASFNIGGHKSLTMTRNSPSYQAFTTPKSSRENGDWGFKRPFPLKSTNSTSTPLIRVKQVDTIENVTDFNSASDLSLTLEKFQEMHVAPLLPKGIDRAGNPIEQRGGVFEEDMDVTDFKHGEGVDRKWKFRGPWLARMDEGAFEEYLQKKVRPKRHEFRQLLRQRLLAKKNRDQKTIALEAGQPAPEAIKMESITEADFIDYLRDLRSDRPTLYDVVTEFLDLAPLAKPVGFVQGLLNDFPAKVSPYGSQGAPQTHPSAGIGYLRTNSFLENHPIFGPQGHRTPVQARIIHPRAAHEPAKLGVGGMVADAPRGDNNYNYRVDRRGRRNMDGIDHIDVVSIGGAKSYVEPEGVVVDPNGSVVLQVLEANAEARFVAEENNNPGIVYHDKKRWGPVDSAPEPRRMGRVVDEMMSGDEAVVDPSTVRTTSQGYGL